jgi:regulator of sigma E protease
LSVWRAGEVIDLTLTPRRTDLPTADGGFETRWLIGLQSGPFFDHPTRSPGPVESLPMAVDQTWTVITNSISGLVHMVKGAISPCNLSGPIGIATTSGAMASEGVWAFIWFIAVLSTAVGLLNLFPIPVLDGGHLVFHAWEAVTGKPPSERAMNLLMTVGIALLGSLMLFAIFTDLTC